MKHLTKEQRYALKAYLQCGVSKREIARRLGVDKSTIYRELQRNKRKRGGYNPDFAQELSEERKKRFGDWEIDLIVGKNNKGAMVTIVERTTSMLMIRKLKKREKRSKPC